MKELSARFEMKPDDVIAELESGELNIWMKAIGREDWIARLNALRKEFAPADALKSFLDPTCEQQMRKEVEARQEEQRRSVAEKAWRLSMEDTVRVLRVQIARLKLDIALSAQPLPEELAAAQQAVEVASKESNAKQQTIWIWLLGFGIIALVAVIGLIIDSVR
jgi:hypothetical protein